MRKERILLILGVWVAVLPYLGFPFSWKNILFTLTGLGLIYFSFLLYKEYKASEEKGSIKAPDSFSENLFHGEKKVEKETEITNNPEPINS